MKNLLLPALFLVTCFSGCKSRGFNAPNSSMASSGQYVRECGKILKDGESWYLFPTSNSQSGKTASAGRRLDIKDAGLSSEISELNDQWACAELRPVAGVYLVRKGSIEKTQGPASALKTFGGACGGVLKRSADGRSYIMDVKIENENHTMNILATSKKADQKLAPAVGFQACLAGQLVLIRNQVWVLFPANSEVAYVK